MSEGVGALDIGEYAFSDNSGMSSPAPLSWRQDRTESLSDWTIVLTCEPPDPTRAKTYHVHKTMLAFGSNRSEYFEKMFKGGGTRMAEDQTQTSKLQFMASACEAFPLLLDFMYGLPLAVDATNVVALRKLSNYLGIKTAFDEAQSFLHKELEPGSCTPTSTFAHHLIEAEACADDKLETAMLRLVAQGLETIEKNMLLALEPAMLMGVVQSELLHCGTHRRAA